MIDMGEQARVRMRTERTSGERCGANGEREGASGRGGGRGIPLQKDYSDRLAPEKLFSHPLRLEWLLQHLSSQARILDHGCGYGRLIDQLSGAGYRNVVGMDFSDKMLTECRSQFPNLTLVRNDGR